MFVLVFPVFAHSATIWSDNFDDGNSSGWAHCPFCGNADMDPVVSGGYGGGYTWSTRSYWQEESGPGYAGYWDACFGDTSIPTITAGSDVYIHFYLKFSSNFVFPTGNSGIKIAVIGYENNGWSSFIIPMITKWDQNKPFFDVYADPDAQGQGGIPDSTTTQTALATGATNDWVNFTWTANQWYEIKLYCKLNTGSNENGILRYWIDNVLMLEDTHVLVGSSPSWNRVQLTNYMSGSTLSYDPSGMIIYMDNFVMSSTDDWTGGTSSASSLTGGTLQ
jgi:hypothetical protein